MHSASDQFDLFETMHHSTKSIAICWSLNINVYTWEYVFLYIITLDSMQSVHACMFQLTCHHNKPHSAINCILSQVYTIWVLQTTITYFENETDSRLPSIWSYIHCSISERRQQLEQNCCTLTLENTFNQCTNKLSHAYV